MVRRLRPYSMGQGALFGSLIVAAMLFLLLGIVLLVAENFEGYHNNLKAGIGFEIYLADNGTLQDRQRLIAAFDSLSGFRSYRLRDKSEAYVAMQSSLGGKFLSEDEREILPNTLILSFDPDAVTLENFTAIDSRLRHYLIVDDVRWGKDWLTSEEPVLALIDRLAYSARILLLAIALLVTGLSIKRTLSFSRETGRALRLLGAGWRRMGLRHLTRGVVLGGVASILGIGILYLIWRFSALSPLELRYLSTSSQLLILLSGLIVGLIAAFLSVRKIVQ